MHKNEVIWLWTKLISAPHKLSHMHPIPGRTSRWCLVLTWLHRHLIWRWCRHVTDHVAPGRHKRRHTDCRIVRRARQLLRVYLLVVHVLSVRLTIVRDSGGGGVLFNGFIPVHPVFLHGYLLSIFKPHACFRVLSLALFLNWSKKAPILTKAGRFVA